MYTAANCWIEFRNRIGVVPCEFGGRCYIVAIVVDDLAGAHQGRNRSGERCRSAKRQPVCASLDEMIASTPVVFITHVLDEPRRTELCGCSWEDFRRCTD